MIKVVFLDIDGVLNVLSDSYTTLMKPCDSHMDEIFVHRLNYIVEQTNAKVVISSSWKSDMLNVRQHLIKFGFRYMDNLIGRTPHGNELQKLTGVDPEDSWLRGLQIQESMKDIVKYYGEIESYVVLEDEISDVCGNMCNAIPRKNVIEVSTSEGLSHSNAVDAKDILNGINLEERDIAIQELFDGGMRGMYLWQAKEAFYKNLNKG